jgi:hypothetical protein
MRRCMLRRGLRGEVRIDVDFDLSFSLSVSLSSVLSRKMEGGKGMDWDGPASSATMAFPTGCVAPVTTHTKPYCTIPTFH